MDGRVRAWPLATYVGGLVVLAAATTSAYLGMRDVMAIGGSCASGGPYEVAVPCPEGTGLLVVGGIFGWFLGAGLTLVGGSGLPGDYSTLAFLAWPGLFLSLGWNFLDYGFDPADGSGTDAGMVFCGVLFFLMGGVPLVFGIKGIGRALWPPDPPPDRSASGSGRGSRRLTDQVRAATSQVRPAATGARTRRRSTSRPPTTPTPTDAPPTDAPPPVGAGASARAGADIVAELERLTELHSRGALDDDEFERAKDILLGAEDRG